MELCQVLLIDIKSLTREKNPSIARKLGVAPATIWGVEVGSRNASNQLYKGMQMLLENIRMSQRIEELEQAIRTMNTVTGPLSLNERGENYKVSSSSTGAAKISAHVKKRLRARKQKDYSAGSGSPAGAGGSPRS